MDGLTDEPFFRSWELHKNLEGAGPRHLTGWSHIIYCLDLPPLQSDYLSLFY